MSAPIASRHVDEPRGQPARPRPPPPAPPAPPRRRGTAARPAAPRPRWPPAKPRPPPPARSGPAPRWPPAGDHAVIFPEHQHQHQRQEPRRPGAARPESSECDRRQHEPGGQPRPRSAKRTVRGAAPFILARSSRHGAEPSLAAAEAPHLRGEHLGGEIGPARVDEVELGIGRLPGQEVRHAELARGAQDQIGIRQAGGVEVRLDRLPA